jgi:hypothetical protein
MFLQLWAPDLAQHQYEGWPVEPLFAAAGAATGLDSGGFGAIGRDPNPSRMTDLAPLSGSQGRHASATHDRVVLRG